MYIISRVSISGFWGAHVVDAEFNEDVNVLIGRNGSGKTTFMEILRAVLCVDKVSLDENEFDEVVVYLKDDSGSVRTIKVEKSESPSRPFPIIKYKISNKTYSIMVVRYDSPRNSTFLMRLDEELQEIRDQISEILKVSSLSVHRLNADEGVEIIDKRKKVLISPVDYRLGRLLDSLARYQLELSQAASRIGDELQKKVFMSLLLSDENKVPTLHDLWEFDKAKEKIRLQSAYKQLKFFDSKISKKIDAHLDSVDRRIQQMKKLFEKEGVQEKFYKMIPIEGIGAISNFVDLAIKAEEETKEVFRPINNFLSTLSRFIEDKSFRFLSGTLVAKKNEDIDVLRLSSGEKQIIIMLVEALLQKEGVCIYLADEPELSLHIDWQRKIVPAIKYINPNSQVIVATHSPEIAGKYSDKMLNMGDILHE